MDYLLYFHVKLLNLSNIWRVWYFCVQFALKGSWSLITVYVDQVTVCENRANISQIYSWVSIQNPEMPSQAPNNIALTLKPTLPSNSLANLLVA